jgi:small subunit ribosomal protein S17
MKSNMPAKNTTTKEETMVNRQKLSGTVVSDKMTDTVVVKVIRFEKHPKYQKYQKISKKYKAHDPGNTKKIGDKVSIESCRPISKDKHFKVIA